MSNETEQNKIEIKTLAEALWLAQKEMKNADLDGTNPHFKSRYATLASVRKAIIPVFNKFDLVVVQVTKVLDGELILITKIIHYPTNQQMEDEMLVPLDGKRTGHAMGSGLTYARRYSLIQMACIVGEDDDDGNAVSKETEAKPITKEQLAKLESLCDETSADKEAFCKHFKINSLPEMLSNDFTRAVNMLNRKKEAANGTGK